MTIRLPLISVSILVKQFRAANKAQLSLEQEENRKERQAFINDSSTLPKLDYTWDGAFAVVAGCETMIAFAKSEGVTEIQLGLPEVEALRLRPEDVTRYDPFPKLDLTDKNKNNE